MSVLIPVVCAALATTVMPKPPYRPFIDPVQIDGFWWMFLPLMALLIAMVYKGVKHPNLKTYWWAVAKMALEIVAGMVLLGAASYLVVEVFARYIVEHAPR